MDPIARHHWPEALVVHVAQLIWLCQVLLVAFGLAALPLPRDLSLAVESCWSNIDRLLLVIAVVVGCGPSASASPGGDQRHGVPSCAVCWMQLRTLPLPEVRWIRRAPPCHQRHGASLAAAPRADRVITGLHPFPDNRVTGSGFRRDAPT